MSLRKSNTFNARTSISSELCNPIEHAHYMPKRSPTSAEALEDILIKVEGRHDAHQHDVAKLLQQFDDKINGRVPVDADGSILGERDVLAIPSFMIEQVHVPESTFVGRKQSATQHQHHSDSGLGSSVASTAIEHNTARSTLSSSHSITTSHSTITRSASAIESSHLPSQHFLSSDAVRHIKKHIVQPILKEESLKEFHPLIEDIPRRIGARFISNLRDLEKTLFFLAPEFSTSPHSFLKFGETSIQCLHTTVDYLSEQDQKLPTDRPYTNNYFLDLVEQIRRYAEIMARTREKQASGEPLDEMDYSPDEEISIAGGLSHNGKPAELVRRKQGKEIPLSAQSLLNEDGPSFKRSLTDTEMDDEETRRSMARRRKSEKPGDVMHPCRVCDKEFKRPCDLTKHEKTHSRPWKCPDSKCRYHDQGWPTEKERDRHVNDKHSQAPTMYKCKFPPCTYSSKRESNCKQHMEKAHDWQYVRSKNNSRNKKSDGSSTSGRTPFEQPLTPFAATSSSSGTPFEQPLTPFPATPVSTTKDDFSPDSPFLASPSVPFYGYGAFGDYRYTPGPSSEDLFAYEPRRQSATTSDTGMTHSSSFSPDQQPGSAFEEALTPEDVPFNQVSFDHRSPLPFDFSVAMQQPTPALSIELGFDLTAETARLDNFGNPAGYQYLSPAGRPDVTLCSPHVDNVHFDEALGADCMDFGQDFTLFDSVSNAGAANMATCNWFPDNTAFGTMVGQLDDSNFESLFGRQ